MADEECVERKLHAAYRGIQTEVRWAEQAISDARSVIYQLLGVTPTETAREAAQEWLANNGRDPRREIMLRQKAEGVSHGDD